MRKFKLNKIKEVCKKTIADFVCSETGSVGVKNAAAVGAAIGAFALGQTSSEAIHNGEPHKVVIIIAI